MNKKKIDFSITELDWQKVQQQIPVVIQSFETQQVLMLGYMTLEALSKTLESGYVTFFSRSKNRLWVKGETSGNYLEWIEIHRDCDGDSLLILVRSPEACCHTGDKSCFDRVSIGFGFLSELEKVICHRVSNKTENSYTAALLDAGIKRMAQKVGEEGVEVALAALDPDENNALLKESADLIFHLLILLHASGMKFQDVVDELKKRNE